MESKSKLEFIITLILLIFIVISIEVDMDQYISGLNDILPFIWIFFFLFDIYKSNKYIKNKPKNEIRIRSNNDSYYYVLPFIMGVILCFISLFFIFQFENKVTSIAILISGIILIFKGLIFIPSVLIKFENGKLYLENGKVSQTFNIEEVEKVILNENNIEFTLSENKKYIFSHLELNLDEIEDTKFFLSENIKTNII